MISISEQLVRTTDILKHFVVSHRKKLLIAACIIFVTGAWVSIHSLQLGWRDLSPVHIALLLFLFAPLGLFYGTWNMMLIGRCSGVRIPFGEAWRIASVAQLAEFLPVPGGAIVRGGAMIQRGVRAGKASLHVLLAAVLWVGCGACAAGYSLGLKQPVGSALGIGGATIILVCALILRREAGLPLALTAVATRMIALIITGLRITFAFFAIGASMPFSEVFPYAFANILGSASSLAPGGLGISESLAAAMASLTKIDPATAFLAVGINRIAGLIVSIVFAAPILLRAGTEERASG